MKELLLLAAICCSSVVSWAQDDMYFKPSSKAQKVKSHTSVKQNELQLSGTDAPSRSYTEDEIDHYNRQGYYINSDTLYLGNGQQSESYSRSESDNYDSDYFDYTDDYYYSNRIARFYNPSVTFSIDWIWGTPYYWNSFDPYGYWYYDNIWYGGYYYPYHYYGWYRPWYGRWHDSWWGGRPHSYWQPRYYAYHGPTGTRNHSFEGRRLIPNVQNRPNSSYGRGRIVRPTNGTFGSRPQSNTSGRSFGTVQNRTNNSKPRQETNSSVRNIFGGSRAIPNVNNGTPSRATSPMINRGGGSFGGSRGSSGGHFGGRK